VISPEFLRDTPRGTDALNSGTKKGQRVALTAIDIGLKYDRLE
jgi:hypothetical protein